MYPCRQRLSRWIHNTLKYEENNITIQNHARIMRVVEYFSGSVGHNKSRTGHCNTGPTYVRATVHNRSVNQTIDKLEVDPQKNETSDLPVKVPLILLNQSKQL